MDNDRIDLTRLNPEWNTTILAIGRTAHRITIAGALIAASLLALGAISAHIDLIAAALAIIPVLFFRRFTRSIAYFIIKIGSLATHFRPHPFAGS